MGAINVLDDGQNRIGPGDEAVDYLLNVETGGEEPSSARYESRRAVDTRRWDLAGRTAMDCDHSMAVRRARRDPCEGSRTLKGKSMMW